MTEKEPSYLTPAPAEPAPRRGLLLGAAALATAAGLGLAWWQTRGTGPTGQQPFAGFWDLRWDTPQGTSVALQDLRGKPLLINFWATWCPPCIEELPLINDFYLKNKANGWQVLALAIDSPSNVQGFLKKMPLEFTVGLAGTNGSEVGRELGNPSGSLPFSVALDVAGTIAQRKLGRLKAEDLAAWAQLK